MNPDALHPQHFTECSNLPKVFKMETNNTKQARLINYAFSVKKKICYVTADFFFELQLRAFVFLTFQIKLLSNILCGMTNSLQNHTHELNSEFRSTLVCHVSVFAPH